MGIPLLFGDDMDTIRWDDPRKGYFVRLLYALTEDKKNLDERIEKINILIEDSDADYGLFMKYGLEGSGASYLREWTPEWKTVMVDTLFKTHRHIMQKYGGYEAREYWTKNNEHLERSPGFSWKNARVVPPKNKREALDYMEKVKSPEYWRAKEKEKKETEAKKKAESEWKRKQCGWIYICRDPHSALYKIGKSVNPEKRMTELIQGRKTELIWKIETNHMDRLENILHGKYKDKRDEGEWFRLSESDTEQIKNKYPGQRHTFRKAECVLNSLTKP